MLQTCVKFNAFDCVFPTGSNPNHKNAGHDNLITCLQEAPSWPCSPSAAMQPDQPASQPSKGQKWTLPSIRPTRDFLFSKWWETRMVHHGTWSLFLSLQLLNWLEVLPSSYRPKMCFQEGAGWEKVSWVVKVLMWWCKQKMTSSRPWSLTVKDPHFSLQKVTWSCQTWKSLMNITYGIDMTWHACWASLGRGFTVYFFSICPFLCNWWSFNF